jgi:tricarballylate dehydrogenase
MSGKVEYYDVIVVGAGVAGLCAAIAAHQEGANVLVLEKAPRTERGGNTRYSDANIRFPHDPDEYCSVKYTKEDFYDDIMRVTGGRANPELAKTFVDHAAEAVEWLTSIGVQWAPPDITKVNEYARQVRGGGEELLSVLFKYLEDRGVKILYETPARKLLMNRKAQVIGVRAIGGDGFIDFHSKAVVLATGGFQANVEMTTKYIGPSTPHYIIRGSRFCTGDGLRMALEIGAQAAGDMGDFHSAVIDARSPRVECGVTNVNAYPYGILVNIYGERFLDEGADFRDHTYVIYGKEILKQPQGIAFAIFDQKVKHLITVKYKDPIVADTIEELAQKLGLDPFKLSRTIKEFNEAVQPGEFNYRVLDGKCTKGINPPKSNWALPIDKPPFIAFPVTGGITFTFGGLKVNTKAQVLNLESKPIPGLYAAGELIGELFYHNYPGGSSVLRGVVFGRIAGIEAAREPPKEQELFI